MTGVGSFSKACSRSETRLLAKYRGRSDESDAGPASNRLQTSKTERNDSPAGTAGIERQERVDEEKIQQEEMFILPGRPFVYPRRPAALRRTFSVSAAGHHSKISDCSPMRHQIEVALMEVDCVIDANRIWRRGCPHSTASRISLSFCQQARIMSHAILRSWWGRRWRPRKPCLGTADDPLPQRRPGYGPLASATAQVLAQLPPQALKR
jgi:hypothetical protein